MENWVVASGSLEKPRPPLQLPNVAVTVTKTAANPSKYAPGEIGEKVWANLSWGIYS